MRVIEILPVARDALGALLRRFRIAFCRGLLESLLFLSRGVSIERPVVDADQALERGAVEQDDVVGPGAVVVSDALAVAELNRRIEVCTARLQPALDNNVGLDRRAGPDRRGRDAEAEADYRDRNQRCARAAKRRCQEQSPVTSSCNQYSVTSRRCWVPRRTLQKSAAEAFSKVRLRSRLSQLVWRARVSRAR